MRRRYPRGLAPRDIVKLQRAVEEARGGAYRPEPSMPEQLREIIEKGEPVARRVRLYRIK